MKRSFTLLISAFCMLISNAQKEYQLNEVTVVASRTTNNAEGYTTNLRGTNLTKGKPAMDVLPFLPNISCENGKFKIYGLTVSEIFVDGVKLADISELKNIPGEMIDKVQVKYLAGVDQNAAKIGGTIMITLRRPPHGGYYGSVTANAEWQRACGMGNEGLGGMINYRYKGLGIYDNMYLGVSKFKENTEQWISYPDLLTFVTETTKSQSFGFRNRLSITQKLNCGAQLGGSYFLSTNRPHQLSVAVNDNSVSSIDKHINTILQEGTIKLSLPLKKKGNILEFTADYFNRNNHKDANYTWDGNVAGNTNEKNNLNLWKLKAEFGYQVSRKLTWKLGATSQWISSTFTPSSTIENDRINVSTIPTSTTGFTPTIYAQVQGMTRKIRYSAGLNWQLNKIGYTDKTNGTQNNNTQWAINPTLQIMMPFGSRMNHGVMLNYKHTLNDIPYTAISSAINWNDSYNYTVGNPRLKAPSADIIMAALSLFSNKVNISALYAHTNNRIYWQTFPDYDNKDIFYRTPINISGQGVWGFGAEWIETPVKWWESKLSGRIEITPENIKIDNVYYGKTRFKEYFSFNNSFTFSNGWGAMLNANLEPTFRTLDRTYHAVYNVNGQIHKMFMDNNLQFAIEFTPVGNRRKLDRFTGTQTISYKYTSPVQYIGLSMTWNFAGGKKVRVNAVDGIQDYHETKDNM